MKSPLDRACPSSATSAEPSIGDSVTSVSALKPTTCAIVTQQTVRKRSAAQCLAEFGALSAVLAASEADLCGRAKLVPGLADSLRLVAILPPGESRVDLRP